MASTSTSSIQKTFKYDVFLSFRGEDTRNKFVGHLYKALVEQGIQTYKDDENIKKGETIDTQLIESIEESRFFIIVFSKDYAGSSWCLDELVKIMECQKANEQTAAYPVFYDVEPTEIRKQSGAVEKAFEKHENKEAAGKWRKALNEAGDLAGWESKNTANGDESKLIEEIVNVIFKKKGLISPTSRVDAYVGIERRIKDAISYLELDADDVRMIGIWGMGGGGKTTLAKAVFDRISYQFEGKAFVENVRGVSKSSSDGMKKLQEQILCSVLSRKVSVNSVHEGTNMMRTFLRGRKVLIVLDDVDDREQLEALADEPKEWFKYGSRVIITTRDKQVLSPREVKFIDVNLLSHAEAICLLSKNAFNRDVPNEGYKELSEQVVNYANGLPLTIKVLGGKLYGQNMEEWTDTINRLREIPLDETLKRLEISYDSLERDHQQIFLDVACILKGWEKDDAIMALESCGFHAKIGLKVLEQRSLITISDDDELGMHDHIEEMGMNIVCRVNPKKPETHSRLWFQQEIEEILANDSGTQPATQCIRRLYPLRSNLMKGLANMKELRFLHLYGPSLLLKDEVSNNLNLPNALRYLRWFDYPFSSLPKTFQANYLVGLHMQKSNMVKLWKDGEEKPFPNLKFLKITWSTRLRALDLSVAPNLESLILEYCEYLEEVHFQVTPNLKELRIHLCYSLEKLHMPTESPKLTSLYLSYSKLRTLHLGITPNLETLRVTECTDMVELRMPAECPKLVDLELGNLKLTTLHLGITLNLKTLRIENCNALVKLHIPAECPKLTSLDLCNSKLRTLHLGITPNLETLRVMECTDMVELRMPAECPKLADLKLGNLKLTTLHLGITLNLKTLRIENCNALVKLHIPAECPKLVNLTLRNCMQFAELPDEIGRSECLKELDITGTIIGHLPLSIFRVKGLRIVGSKWILVSCGFNSEIFTLLVQHSATYNITP